MRKESQRRWLDESLEEASGSSEWKDVADAVLEQVQHQLRDFHVAYFSDLTTQEQAFVMRRAEEAVRSTRRFKAFERRLDRTLEESLVRVVRDSSDSAASTDDIVVACDAAARGMVRLLRELPEERRTIERLFNAPLDNAVLRTHVWSLHVAATEARRTYELRVARDRLSTISSMDVEITRVMRETLALHVPELAERAEVDMRLFMAMSVALSFEHAERVRDAQARPSDDVAADDAARPVDPRLVLALVPILLVFRGPIAMHGAAEVYERLAALKARLVPRAALVGLVAELLEARDEPLLRALKDATGAETSRTALDALLGEHLERGLVGLLACDVDSLAAGGGEGAADDTLLFVWDQCVQQHRPHPRPGFVDLGFGHYLAAAAAALLQCVQGELVRCATREQCSAALRLAAAKVGVSRLRRMISSSFAPYLERALGHHLSADAHLDFVREDGDALERYLASPRAKKAAAAAAAQAAAEETRAAESAMRRRLNAFYAQHAPDQRHKADALSHKYVGHEETLYDALAKKYGADPRDVALPALGEEGGEAMLTTEERIQRDLERESSMRARDPRQSLAGSARALDPDLEAAQKRHLPRHARAGGGGSRASQRRAAASTSAYAPIQRPPARVSPTALVAWPPLHAQRLRARCAVEGAPAVLRDVVRRVAVHNTCEPSAALEALVARELPFLDAQGGAGLRNAAVAEASPAKAAPVEVAPLKAAQAKAVPAMTESAAKDAAPPSSEEESSEDEEAAEKAAATAALSALLEKYYAAHAPEQLGRVPSLVRKYVGNEESLFSALEKKYKADPRALRAPIARASKESEESELDEADADVAGWLQKQGFSNVRAVALASDFDGIGASSVSDLREMESEDFDALGVTANEKGMMSSSHAMDDMMNPSPTASPTSGRNSGAAKTSSDDGAPAAAVLEPPAVTATPLTEATKSDATVLAGPAAAEEQEKTAVAEPFAGPVKLVGKLSSKACTLTLTPAAGDAGGGTLVLVEKKKQVQRWELVAGLAAPTAKHANRFTLQSAPRAKQKKPSASVLQAISESERDAWLARIAAAVK